MSFWEKNIKGQLPIEPQQEVVLNEEAFQALIEEPETDIFEEEEDNLDNLMSDANLRLEQGRLYQMVLQNDIFADTNADPRAIKNVQREIRKHAKERLETLLGIRQEQGSKQTIVSSPFNDVEVVVLKMLASRLSQGESEKTQTAAPVSIPAPPKKDGITAISGTVKHTSAPVKEQPKQLPKAQPQQQTKKSSGKSAISSSDPKITKPIENMTVEELEAFQKSKLKKPIDQMTPEELAEHDKQTLENRARNYARKPDNMIPHPNPQQLEMMYTAQVAQTAAPGSAVSTIMGMMNSRKP